MRAETKQKIVRGFIISFPLIGYFASAAMLSVSGSSYRTTEKYRKQKDVSLETSAEARAPVQKEIPTAFLAFRVTINRTMITLTWIIGYLSILKYGHFIQIYLREIKSAQKSKLMKPLFKAGFIFACQFVRQQSASSFKYNARKNTTKKLAGKFY